MLSQGRVISKFLRCLKNINGNIQTKCPAINIPTEFCSKQKPNMHMKLHFMGKAVNMAVQVKQKVVERLKPSGISLLIIYRIVGCDL